jgi:type I restriction enzyme S subunit
VAEAVSETKTGQSKMKKCFAEFVTLQRGFDLPKTEMREGPFPVVGSTSIIGHHDEFKVEPPGVVTGRSGSLGTVQFLRERYWPHNTSLWVKDFKGNDPQFVYYRIQGLDFARFNAGAGVPTLNRNHLDTLEVDVPPLPVQRRIAGILSAYDELMENSQRRIQILEEMARALYREWFVHFRFPGSRAEAGAKADGHEKLPRVASPLGDIPQGWEVKKLGDILELNYGKALKQEDRSGGAVPVFGSSGIVGQHDTALVNGPGIIVGRKGNVGSVFWCEEDFFVIDTAYFVTSSLPLRFLFYVMPTLNFINSDAAVPGLSRNQAYTLEILVPPAALLKKFCELADTFERQASTLQRQIQNLRRTRDLLLPRLLSGQATHPQPASPILRTLTPASPSGRGDGRGV